MYVNYSVSGQRRAVGRLWHGIMVAFIPGPSEEFLCYGHRILFPCLEPSLEREIFLRIPSLQFKQLVAVTQASLCRMLFPRIFGQNFESICEFSPHVGPTPNRGYVRRQLTMVGLISIGVEESGEACEKILGVFPGPAGLVVIQHHRPFTVSGSPVDPHIAYDFNFMDGSLKK